MNVLFRAAKLDTWIGNWASGRIGVRVFLGNADMAFGNSRSSTIPPSPPLFSRDVRTSLFPVVVEEAEALRIEPTTTPPSLAGWMAAVFSAVIIAFFILLGWHVRATGAGNWWIPIAISPVCVVATVGAWYWHVGLEGAEAAMGPWLIFYKEQRLVSLPRLKRRVPVADCKRLELVSGRWLKSEIPGQWTKLQSEFPVNREIHLIVRTPEGGEERLFVLYSMVRGKITLAAKAIGRATGLEILEKEQMAQRVME